MNLSSLPEELLWKIFTFLAPKDLSELELVEKKLSFFINDFDLWKKVVQSEYVHNRRWRRILDEKVPDWRYAKNFKQIAAQVRWESTVLTKKFETNLLPD